MFQIGQEVVAIANDKKGDYKIGDTRTVLGVCYCSECGGRKYDLGFIAHEGMSGVTCSQCNHNYYNGKIWWSDGRKWRPVISTFKKISFSRVLELTEASEN